MKSNKRWQTKTATPAITNNEWTNEMKLELLKIDRKKQKQRIYETNEGKYGKNEVQCLRDSPARISKNKALLNQLEVQNQSETVNNANHEAAIPGLEDQIEAVKHVNHVDVIPGPKINHRETMETENTNRQKKRCQTTRDGGNRRTP